MLESEVLHPSTRERLVIAAAELLMRQSYGAVSVDDICRAAVVKKGTFYHHFPSKTELALAAYDFKWAMAQEKLGDCFSKDLSPAARLEKYAEGAYLCHKEFFDREGKIYGCPIASAGHEMGTQDERIRQKTKEIFDAHCAYFEGLLADMPAFFKSSPENRSTRAHELFSYALGVLYQAKVANDPEVIRRDLLPGLKRLLGPAND